MAKTIAPFILVLAALWVTWCAGVSNGRALADAMRADSVSRVIGESVSKAQAAFLWRDSVRNDSVARQANVIARLKARTLPRDTVVRLVADTAVQRVVEAQLAVRDSQLAITNHQLSLYAAMLADRDSLLILKDRQIQALTVARDEWRKVAEPSLISRAGRVLPYVAAGFVAAKLLH